MLRSLIIVKNSRVGLSNFIDSWSRMSLKELKLECKNRGLKVSGKKSELLGRLRQVDKSVTKKDYSKKNSSRIFKTVTSKKQATSIDTQTKLHEDIKTKCNSSSDDNLPKTRINDTITTTFNESNTKPLSIEHNINAYVGHNIRQPIIKEHGKNLTENKASDNEAERQQIDQKIGPSDLMSIRDKLFLLTSTTCIIIWWWLPYVPAFVNKILKSYRYLQSFF